MFEVRALICFDTFLGIVQNANTGLWNVFSACDEKKTRNKNETHGLYKPDTIIHKEESVDTAADKKCKRLLL